MRCESELIPLSQEYVAGVGGDIHRQLHTRKYKFSFFFPFHKPSQTVHSHSVLTKGNICLPFLRQQPAEIA